jgi:hypothetical protein
VTIDALAEPEAKWDQDTYGMKQGGMQLQERDWDIGRRLGLTSADSIRPGYQTKGTDNTGQRDPLLQITATVAR